jgi:hypothetical protein
MSHNEEVQHRLSDDEVKNSSCYRDCDAARVLAVCERDQLKTELDRTLQQWSVTKGDLSTARKTIDDLLDKHNRRWKELVSLDCSLFVPDNSKEEFSSSTDRETERLMTARTINELENKLQHALDAIRQTDSLRTSFADASSLNDIYQAKIEELKLKLSDQSTGHAADHPTSAEIVPNETSLSKSLKNDLTAQSDTIISSNASEDKNLRRMKKELSAALLSKDQAKAKYEVSKKSIP